jgi:hypothetical protein
LSRVYFIRCAPNGPIKIGVTTSLKHRLDELQVGSHQPLEVIHSTPGDFAVERKLHRAFRDLRLRGEWFKADDRLLAAIEELRRGQCTVDDLVSRQRGQDLVASWDDERHHRIADLLYELARAAISMFGGVEALAAAAGRPVDDVSSRLNRRHVHGQRRRLFLDDIATLMTKPEVAAFLVCGFALIADAAAQPDAVNETALPPGEREGRRADMAAALGVRAEDLR